MKSLLTPVWEPGEHVLAAVSGGADSVALLLMLKDAEDRGELRLSAAHFEHGIRGEASVSDALFVRDLCARLNVPCVCGCADVPALARERGIGLEQAAREARYAFLRRAMLEVSAGCIALAHHQGDQAETVLMHLLRGSGQRGAGGMRPRENGLIRPLLSAGKAQLIAYLESRGQPYVTDQTNFEPDGPRNRLRLWVMPELTKIYPGAALALCRYAAIAGEEDLLLDRCARDWLRAREETLPMGVRIRVDGAAEPALARRALRDRVPEPEFDALQRLTGLYFAASGKVSLPGGMTAERAGRHLYLIDPRVKPPPSMELRDGARLGEYGLVRLEPCDPKPRRDDPYRQALNAAALSGAALRTRRPGDRFRMLGAPGDRLLSDVLTDRKVDRPVRDFLPLVAAGGRVLWIPGLGVSEEARIVPGCEALLLRYEGAKML